MNSSLQSQPFYENLDSFLMLLSADWFKPYWRSINIELSTEKTLLVVKLCRITVKAFMQGAPDYYLIDFGAERQAKTWQSFLEALKINSLSNIECDVIQTAAAQFCSFSAASTTSYALFKTVILELSRKNSNPSMPGPRPRISAVIQETLQQACQTSAQFYSHLDEIEAVAEASTTQWDTYLRSLMPGTPEILFIEFDGRIVTPQFCETAWTLLRSKLNKEQLEMLRTALISRIEEIADPAFILEVPRCMV